MPIFKKKLSKLNIYIFIFLIFITITYLLINKFQKDKVEKIKLKPIYVNLLTSVHPSLAWKFEPVEPKIKITPGEVVTVEYYVENLGSKKNTGIATFAYFPSQFGQYINKINCFCYDARTLKPKEKVKSPKDFVVQFKVNPPKVTSLNSYTRLEKRLLNF